MISGTGKVIDIKRKLFQLDNEKLYDYEIVIHRNKRSKNANSYLWKLVGQIADLMGSSKEEIYLEELKKYGQSLLIPVSKGKKPDGYFKYYEFECTGKIGRKEADWYKIYKGSSTYDTREMSFLLNGVVEDCKELEIPTLEDYRIEKLIEEWEGTSDES